MINYGSTRVRGPEQSQLTAHRSHTLLRGNQPRPAPTPGHHILIVEDYPDGRETQRLLLELLGHRVDTAADGAEGVRKAVELRPEVALVDIGLPRLNGYEVARQVRAALGQQIFLIAMSAYSDSDSVERGREAGFDAYLVKPVGLDELNYWLDVADGRNE